MYSKSCNQHQHGSTFVVNWFDYQSVTDLLHATKRA